MHDVDPGAPTVAEVMEQADDAAEEARLLFALANFLDDFVARNGQKPMRQLLIDSRMVDARREVVENLRVDLILRASAARSRSLEYLRTKVVA